MTILESVADSQAKWSTTANGMKSTIDRARWCVFALSSLGAVLASVASQLPEGNANARTWVAITAAICLAFATLFTQRLLGPERITAWVRSRAISERLKREAYRYATKAAPYDDPAKADDVLRTELQKIDEDAKELLEQQIPAKDQGSSPRVFLGLDEYLARRTSKQIAFYEDRAKTYQSTASQLRSLELALAGAATLLTAVASVVAKPVILGVHFDFAALTAVLTTLGGAVIAHIEAERYSFLVVTYRATALQLQRRVDGAKAPLSDFVNDCENILSAENASWIAKQTRQSK
ncbi:hypothetical protein SE92_18030 [Bradyrhizobium sp. AT1]|uniref:DUF4231 domain-containing protein n=1 Tax=Bradyrhizobium sp. AT1 TaxID=574934 RepID=UPI00079B6CF1|nr:DUF4231 domain-containing protein [Bradyrhizobium sp. AT1]KYG21908.1 hypothetical protein SE92_18030 [Bradyrhizobium sp. AT1]